MPLWASVARGSQDDWVWPMQAHEFSYLDLSVLPETRPLVLSSSAAILFDEEFSEILWANPPGAKLFGGAGIFEILSTSVSDSLPIIRQFHLVSSQVENDKPVVRGFRIKLGERSMLHKFEITQVELPGELEGFLVRHIEETQNQDENEISGMAVEALEGFADAAAIVDDFGLTLSNSEQYAELGPPEDDLLEMLEILKSEADRMIKRPIVSHSGETLALGLARISDSPGRNLVVLQSSRSDQQLDSETVQLQTRSGSDLTEAAIEEERSAPSGESLHEPAEPGRPPRISEESRIQSGEAAESDSLDSAGPVRFAWTIDDQGIIQSVSPELGEVVGPNAADIVGRKWHDIATVFGFDTSSEIKALLEGRDTWSGKTVLWPVQGTDMVVPVDLAALPAFGNARQFEGFKGFGIIRTADSILDPDETGLALSGITSDFESEEDEPMESGGHGEQSSEDAGDWEIDEVSTNHSNSQPTDNVVPLVPKSEPVETLSEDESTAFRQIGERLRQDVPEGLPSGKPDTSLIAALPVAILVYRQQETLFANQALLQSTGYESLEALSEAGGITAILNNDVKEDEAPSRQYLTTKSGERKAITPLLHTVPWDGQKALLLSFVPAERMSDEEMPAALELTKISEIQNILDTATDGVILLDEDGSILSLNASAEALFGIRQADAIEKPFTELFARESRDTVQDYVNGQLSHGVERLLNDGREVIATESGGGLIPVFLTISPMHSSGKLCAVIRDMTSWKKVEEELTNARRQAETASEQKSDFLAHVSHEIRVPLNSIIGFSDVMLEERFGPIDNDRYLDYLQDIKRSGMHVLELINDLLDLSKIEAGKLELSFEAVDLNQIVAETVALVQPQANENRIIIRTSLSLAVPKVVADPRSIRQIILNLVSNAIKFSEPNSQVIVSTVYESSGEVALRIRDTGKGMNEKQIQDAMKPFQQAHTIDERSSRGTGLGLPLTKALVEANRAHFELESEPDHGTIAHVNFPSQRVLAE